jgi:hypothetical protein
MGNKQVRPAASNPQIQCVERTGGGGGSGGSGGTIPSQFIVNAPSTCDVNKVTLNTLKRDLQNKQTDVDNCDPAARRQRQYEAAWAEFGAFIQTKKTDLQKELQIFDQTVSLAQELDDSMIPLREYLSELKVKKEKLAKENEQLEVAIRSNRRRFIDGDPQEELPTVLGLKTSDDKVMLFFWSAYLMVVAASSVVILSMYGSQMGITDRSSMIASVGMMVVAFYGIAYWCIYKFA